MKYFKNKRGYVVYAFIIMILFFGCMNMKTHVNQINNPYKEDKLKIDKKFEKGGTNFVFLLKEASPIFEDICELLPGPCEPTIISSASGLVLHSDKSSIFVLTAAHFCVENTDSTVIFKEKIIGFANDKSRDLYMLKVDIKNDLCLLMGPKLNNDKFYDIKITDKFTVGEDVFTVAAPLGMGGPKMRMIFEGKLSGCNDRGCVTTIPATFGSSGGGIYNSKNELITIIMAVPHEFDHVIISPSNQALIKFIRDIDFEIDIYPY